jgi:hypothetical protein
MLDKINQVRFLILKKFFKNNERVITTSTNSDELTYGLNPDDLAKLKSKIISETSCLLNCTECFAEKLLRKVNWIKDDLINDWKLDAGRFSQKYGISKKSDVSLIKPATNNVCTISKATNQVCLYEFLFCQLSFFFSVSLLTESAIFVLIRYC